MARLTNQDAFDAVTKHLFAQGQQSLLGNSTGSYCACALRGLNGMKCAIGVLIPDQMYRDINIGRIKNVNQSHIRFLMSDFTVIRDLFASCDINVLTELQTTHDDSTNWASTTTMKSTLRQIASDYNLDRTILDSVSFDDNR